MTIVKQGAVQPSAATTLPAGSGFLAPLPSSSPSSPPPPAKVQMLGRYRLLRILGEGGMGIVYEAEHAEIGRRVAIKVLRAHLVHDSEAVSRFFKEALAVNQINHPGIIQVFDMISDAEGTYLVMEFLDGRSLREHIDADGALSQPALAELGAQIAESLAAVHEAGIIHRDLKPENVLLETTTEGALRARVLDFGIAKLTNLDRTTDLAETADGIIMGTPRYMAPEQACGADLDHRTDIYSFGTVLYEALTGRPPFEGSNVGEYLLAHMAQAPVPPIERDPGKISREMSDIIMACLAKAPADRPGSLVEVAQQLRTAGNRPPHVATLSEPPAIAVVLSPPPTTASATSRSRSSANSDVEIVAPAPSERVEPEAKEVSAIASPRTSTERGARTAYWAAGIGIMVLAVGLTWIMGNPAAPTEEAAALAPMHTMQPELRIEPFVVAAPAAPQAPPTGDGAAPPVETETPKVKRTTRRRARAPLTRASPQKPQPASPPTEAVKTPPPSRTVILDPYQN